MFNKIKLFDVKENGPNGLVEKAQGIEALIGLFVLSISGCDPFLGVKHSPN